MTPTRKVLIWLIVLTVVDVVIPVPITGLILLYILLARPAWFPPLVNRVYQQGSPAPGGES